MVRKTIVFRQDKDVLSKNPDNPHNARAVLILQAILFGYFLLGQQEKVTQPPQADGSPSIATLQ